LLKDQSNSLTLEWISYQIGRWGGSSRVNEGMGVNHPSVKALKPNHDREICATCNLAEKRQERKCGKGWRENTCDRDRGRELEKLWKHREF
jgi:hypothetical protein